MGGHRCTYRNCTVRSDGKIHMFHYPVFDKVRCHQWLSNAQKVEFLNLKVSQLKNRVVCQHHFKDECFMNYKKDKLIFDAVPTENGPFCESQQADAIHPPRILNSISLDDIENEYLTLNDKKANYSVKYGDFLTNGDLLDLDPSFQNVDNTKITEEKSVSEKGFDAKCFIKPGADKFQSKTINQKQPVRQVKNTHNAPKKIELINDNNIQNTQVAPTANQDISINEVIMNVPIYFDNNDVNKSFEVPIESFNNVNVYTPSCMVLNNYPNSNIVTDATLIDNNGQFISKQDLSQYSDVSNNMHNDENQVKVMSVEYDENRQINVNVEIDQSLQQNAVQNSEGSNSLCFEKPLKPKKIQILSEKKITNPISKPITVGKLDPLSPSGILQLPNKRPLRKGKQIASKKIITPERVAAIQEKRKFNMKLRDIIESCLDKLDREDADNYVARNRNHKGSEKVSTFLAKEPELPNVHEYTIAFLENRLQKMENTLLSKIDANTQRILELKNTVTPHCSKKTIHTQTVANKEAHKKQLYQEISQFLSPDVNSLVYEELFINKHMQKTIQSSPTAKRRKIR